MCPIESCNGIVSNCQFCGQKEDCILLAILNKIEKLDNKNTDNPCN